MSIFKVFLIANTAAVVFLFSLIVWMNLTPGYFQRQPEGCPCAVGYYTKEEMEQMRNRSVICICAEYPMQDLLDEIKLLLAKLDFNK